MGTTYKVTNSYIICLLYNIMYYMYDVPCTSACTRRIKTWVGTSGPMEI